MKPKNKYNYTYDPTAPLYQKFGGEFVQVSVPESFMFEQFLKGDYLVRIKQYSRERINLSHVLEKLNLDESHIQLIAALLDFKDEFIDAFCKQDVYKVERDATELTEKQKQVLEDFNREFTNF